LSDATRRTLRGFLPPEASVANPVDMIASAGAREYQQAVTAVLADGEVDMVLALHVTPLLSNPIQILEHVGQAAAQSPGDKPVLAVMMATEDFYDRMRHQADSPPVYRFPESAARAAQMLARYAGWRRRPADEAIPEFAVDDAAVAALLDDAGDGYLEPDQAFRLLDLYGVPLARWRLAGDRAAAAAAAREVGLPVVIKAVAPELVHKSDVGAVAVDLRSPGEVEAALAEIESAVTGAGHQVSGYLVQEMVRGGHEVIFGISTDPRFGPLLMFGLGGKYVEVFQDVRFGVTPLRPHEAGDMIRAIRGFKLLTGVRGEPAADLELLEEVLLRLAQLAQRHPRVRELDINPFLAAAERSAAKAVDVRIRVESE
jgi:acyl-CoA synthetase (NDP forming)